MFNRLVISTKNSLLGVPLAIILTLVSCEYLVPILSMGIIFAVIPLFIFFFLIVLAIISITSDILWKRNKVLNKIFVTIFLPTIMFLVLLLPVFYSQLVISFAKKSGNYDLCNKAIYDPEGILKENCYGYIAVTKNDAEGCKYMQDGEGCYLDIARETHNPNLCKYTASKNVGFMKYDVIGKCIEEFTKYEGVELCVNPEATMGNQIVQDTCFDKFVTHNGKKEFCSRIVNSVTRAGCLR